MYDDSEEKKFTYPKDPANQTQVKGELYFRRMELTGSSEGTDKNPKVSLLQIYKDEIIPSLERKVVERFGENGTVNVVIVRQEDGAGPHKCKKYMKEIEELFKERGWLIFLQPPNSPLLNVHDACVFPMLSKLVSHLQAVMFGNRALEGDELNEAVMEVWRNKDNREAISRAFAGHHQIVNAVLECKGDNKYLSNSKGLSFGVRKHYFPTEDGEGVVSVDMLLSAGRYEDTAQYHVETRATRASQAEYDDKVQEEVKKRALKYEEPKLSNLGDINMEESLKEFVLEHMDATMMDDEMKTHWHEEMPRILSRGSRRVQEQG